MKRTKDEDKEESATDQASPSTSNGTDATPPAAVASSSALAAAAAAAASVRTTGRVKKPKQVYDPSDNYISRASNRSSLSSGGATAAATASAGVASNEQSPPANALTATEANDSLDSSPSPSASEKQPQPQQQQQPPPLMLLEGSKVDTCQKCNKSEPKRGSGHKSNFLTCKTCMKKWHFPCLAVDFDNLVLARKKYKCEKCRYCNACNIRGRNLPICSVCAEAYHPHCNNKALKPSTKAIEVDPKWKCFRCEGSSDGNSNNTNNTNSNNNITINNTSSSGGEQQPSPLVKKSNAGRKKRVQSDPADQKKPAKMEKLEKPAKLDKPDKKDKLDRPDKSVKLEKLDKLDKPEKQDKPEKVDKPEKQDKPEKPEKLGKPKKPEKLKEPSPPLELKREPEDIDDQDNGNPEKRVKLEEPEQTEEWPKYSVSPRLSAPSSPPAEETEAAAVIVDIQTQPVSSWTVEQVVGFVGKRYPNEASVFRYQDIDGASLLLLTRQDVMTRFGLKLGPALRVFELVLSLQSQSNDVAIAWVE